MQLYARERRDFRGVNIAGALIGEHDLSGADFSGANIRGTMFINTKLHNVNFTKAKAGLPYALMLVQKGMAVSLAGMGVVLLGFSESFVAPFFKGDFSTEEIAIGFVDLSLFLVILLWISLNGFTARSLGRILSATILVILITIVGTLLYFGESAPPTNAIETAISGAGTVFCSIVGVAVIATTTIIASEVAVAIVALAIVVVFGFGFESISSGNLEFSTIIATIVLLLGSLSGIYIGWQAIDGNEKFEVIRVFGSVLSSIGGTDFCGADLTGSNFQQASLGCTSFADNGRRKTTVTRVFWKNAEKLNRARLGSTILKDHHIRALLTTPEKGYKLDLTDANLRGANLKGATLEGAVLRRAILSDALLEKAMLKDAILTEVQAVNADFTDACLTGAILEAWNIDSATTLKNIDCQYVFLRETPNERGLRERRPHNPDKMFQPGDFEKFFKEMLDEVQILIRDGIDPIAFRAAMQNIMEQNPEIAQDSIKAYEKQGEDVLLTLQVPSKTDKGKLEHDWDSGYQLGLKAGREAAQLESGSKFEKLALLLAGKSITTIQRTEVMTGNDQSQNIDVKGNFTVTANNSVVSLRDTSGQVTNQITQLGDEATQAQLKDMLAQLQAAIEAELNLSDEEKTEALEEVKQIATAGQSPQDGPMKKVAKRSLNVLKGMTVGVGAATTFVTACNGLLPAIALLFGL